MDIEQAIWAGDVDWLQEHYGCVCCCSEHTFGRSCPAFQWGGCRGGTTDPRDEYEAWVRHYERFHGMSRETFDGVAQ